MSDQTSQSLPDHCACCNLPAVPEEVGPKRLADEKVYCADCAYAVLGAAHEALKAEALEICGSVYGMLTAGFVDNHDRIMRACNELAEFGRRLTGEAPPLPPRSGANDDSRLKENDRG